MIGSVFSNCLIEKKLGEGGMGAVYLATRKSDGRRVALKFMSPEQARMAPWRARFLQTAEAVQAISHPNIARVYSVHDDADMPHFLMEVVKGEPLDERLKRKKRLSPLEAIRIARDIANGLGAAHTTGLVHRDVKPANVLLSHTGKVKIIDFGLGKSTLADQGLTYAGQIMGTPNYMAPEQWGSHSVDTRCDIFSLGATLYHLATGALPFLGRSPMEVAALIKRGDFLAPRTVRPDLSEDLELAIYMMMSVDRLYRYQTMSQCAEDLQRILENRPVNVPRLEEITKGKRKRYPLVPGASFKIGRKSITCHLAFQDRTLSREHAEVVRTEAGFLLRDLDSKSGTFVRDSRVNEVTLKDMDTVRLGARSFVFRNGKPNLASSSVEEVHRERQEAQAISEPMLRGLMLAGDRRTVLCQIEMIAPGFIETRVRATQRLLGAVVDSDTAKRVGERLGADLKAQAARTPTRLFMITHENLGDRAGPWLAWWDKAWALYPEQVGPHLPPLLAQPRLRLLKVQGAKKTIDLSSGLDFVVGRDTQCGVRLRHPSVSRQHSTIMRLHERMAIRDEASRLGTVVNGERIQVAFLSPGDKLHLGRVKLVYEEKLPAGVKAPVQAGAFPIDPGAFQVLVELRHPSTARSLVGFLQAEQRHAFLEAEARWLCPRDEDLRTKVVTAARKVYGDMADTARELLPKLLKAKANSPEGWKAAFKKRQKSLPHQVLPMGWSLPI